MWQALLSPITSIIDNTIGKLVLDKDLALKLQTEITQQTMQLSQTQMQGAVDIILAEAKGESWLQRNCRPLFTVSINYILVTLMTFNFIIVPIANAFGSHIIPVPIPSQIYMLMEIAVGGYIGVRSWEKVSRIKEKK